MNNHSPHPNPSPSRRLTLVATLLLCATLPACGDPSRSPSSTTGTANDVDAALAAMSTETLASAIRTLSSDEFEGRAPSTPGEELTAAYLVEQLEAAGLEPGNGDSFFQNVPLVALTEQGQPVLTVKLGEEELEYRWTEDFVAWTRRVVESESIEDSEMVFVGYGVVAPEYGWNDYEGVPSLYTDSGIDHVEHGEEWTLARRADYVANRYHKPSDEFDPSWDLTGAMDDLELLFRVGYRIAAGEEWPNWREGNEFRAIRDRDLGRR